MKVYFVRHAQSSNNAHGLLHQYDEGELSEFGLKQAMFVANRFGKIDIDVIISSPFERAKETAMIIEGVIKKPIKYTELLSEFRGPHETEGLPKDDPVVLRINKLMDENRHDAHWKFSNEESYFELRKRAIDLSHFLKKQTNEHILCITHGLFLRVIIAVMMFGEELTREELLKLMRFIKIDNTGITVCELLKNNNWKLITLNDHAHLG
ncbi:MAG: phosphoglycerate mutase family protein [bacterium]|nr:phosphoglycerate mutase family protein [bacterium]